MWKTLVVALAITASLLGWIPGTAEATRLCLEYRLCGYRRVT
jgi:hypothetical protein